MSDPDRNSSPSVTVSPSLIIATETTSTVANNVRTLPSQPPPTPPPLPPPYRAIAPLQLPHTNLYTQSIPNGQQNSPHQLHHQDPSAVMYPFAHPSRGFSSRPVRMSSPSVADSSVMALNQSGHHPRPGFAYNHQQFGMNQMDAMMHLARARNAQIHLFPHPGAGSPVGPGHFKGFPHFLQPRVAPPQTSILDTNKNKNARSRDAALVLVRGRKVRITEGASLYSLSRSWLRNGAHDKIQSQRSATMKPLPKPLPVDMMEASVLNDPAEEPTDEDKEDEESVKQLSDKDLLKRHIERAKKVRARLKEERLRKITRYKARLALLLPQSGEQCRNDD